MAKITLVNYAMGDKWVPLGCLQILAVLRNEGHQVKFIDLQIIDSGINDPEQLFDDSEYLLISTISMMLPWLFRTTKLIKDKRPDKKIILGGPGVSQISEEILKQVNSVDYVVEGEGETAIVKLINMLEDKSFKIELSNIANLIYRKNDKIIRNKVEKKTALNSHHVDRTDVHLNNYNIVSSIITSYGCPYNCGFCYKQNMWGGRVHLKPLKQIFEEIQDILKRFDTNYIVFVDDLFFLSKKRCYEFFNMYNLGGYKFRYVILGVRIDMLDYDMLTNLNKTNCVSLSFGLESASNNILKKIDKRFTLDKALQTINLAKMYIPDISPSFIVGFPFESIKEFYQTIKLASTLYKQGLHVVINFLRPIVGTKIYNEYKNELFTDFRGTIKPFELGKDLMKIILDNSILYSWYYTYKTPGLEEKLNTYRELNIKYTRIQHRLLSLGVQ